ncbi:thiamine pyrophosphate-dependent enzyme [Streptomyces sp. NPDC059679]|uniref:thiamine pyrophosphate-dependent enzyme n=1 Tax=Streptomyces sp. NPDC059679 TaxID=3346903 RepID=UPI0036B45321
MYSPRTHLTSGGFSSMGWAVPAAIGAKPARPDRTVVCVLGDGDFLMTAQEIAPERHRRSAGGLRGPGQRGIHVDPRRPAQAWKVTDADSLEPTLRTPNGPTGPRVTGRSTSRPEWV